MLFQDFFASARLNRVHKKKFLLKSAVYYLYHLKSNNIIVQRENHQYKKKKHFYPWLTLLNMKLSCAELIVVNSKDLLYKLYKHLLYKLALRVICQEQINGLLVVIHLSNIHELTSIRFLKLNLECENIKMRRKIYEHLFFSFMRLFWITVMQSDTSVVSIAAVFI